MFGVTVQQVRELAKEYYEQEFEKAAGLFKSSVVDMVLETKDLIKCFEERIDLEVNANEADRASSQKLLTSSKNLFDIARTKYEEAVNYFNIAYEAISTTETRSSEMIKRADSTMESSLKILNDLQALIKSIENLSKTAAENEQSRHKDYTALFTSCQRNQQTLDDSLKLIGHALTAGTNLLEENLKAKKENTALLKQLINKKQGVKKPRKK